MRAEPASVEFKLRSAQGHLDAVIRMVTDDRYCIEVLHQLAAVRGALDRVQRDVLEGHLRGCVPEALAEGRIDEAVDEVVGAALGVSGLPARSRSDDGAHRCAHRHTPAPGGDR